MNWTVARSLLRKRPNIPRHLNQDVSWENKDLCQFTLKEMWISLWNQPRFIRETENIQVSSAFRNVPFSCANQLFSITTYTTVKMAESVLLHKCLRDLCSVDVLLHINIMCSQLTGNSFCIFFDRNNAWTPAVILLKYLYQYCSTVNYTSFDTLEA